MKRKIGSLLLAFALPLTSCNFNLCSACGYQYYESGSFSYTQKRELEEKIRKLQSSLDKLEKEKEIKQLQEKLQQLEKSKNDEKNSSLWASTKRSFKNFFSTKLGAFGSACAILGVLAAMAGLLTTGVAAYECSKDDKCHFTDKSFLEKFNAGTFKKALISLSEFFEKAMKNIHTVQVELNN